MKHALAGMVLGTLSFDASVAAADLRQKAPVSDALYSWTGFYFGGHAGYGGGGLGPGTNPLPEQGVFFPPSITGLIGGFQAGYNRQLSNHVVVGIETDISFPSPPDPVRATAAPSNTALDYIATARGRIGYASGKWLPYLTGGVAWGRTQVNLNDGAGDMLSTRAQTHLGWSAGGGIEFAVGGDWSARLEYDYVNLARRSYDPLPGINVDPQIHVLKVGLNYRPGDLPSWTAPITPRALPESADWNVHAQTTLLPQAYPAIRSPYEGANSLPGGGQGRETWTATGFLGVRLWQGGEFYFNPELNQGFGLNGTLGLAGFSNGEAQKAGAATPRFRPQRYYIRQTFGFGGEQEDLADAANRLPGKRDIDRVTLIVGRFAVGDFFDGNMYAKDPRADFMNWAMWSSAAYDFPADQPGLTRGGIVELNRKHWAVRAGLFQVPNAPNSDVLTFQTGGTAVEFEGRYEIMQQPGKFRLGAFANRGNSGNFHDAMAIQAANPALDINGTIVSLRRDRPKYGFYFNTEQQIVKDVGLFARASWNDGQNEIMSFTDIDRSLSAGVSVKGSYWGRPGDTVGLGGAINGLSRPHRDFFAAGGLGQLIGDGRLNYSNERIFETYYALAIDRHFTFTADYQLVVNPAYNADRGPVSIFAGRLHGEF